MESTSEAFCFDLDTYSWQKAAYDFITLSDIKFLITFLKLFFLAKFFFIFLKILFHFA